MTGHSNPNQNKRILDYLEERGTITQYEALYALGVMRLASRMSDLKKQGYPVESKMITVKNRYGETCRVKQYSMGSGQDG